MFINAAVIIFSFLLKLLPLNKSNVYSYLWRHNGASISKLFGDIVKIHLKKNKLKQDLSFIRTCKKEELIPTFARIRLANPRIRDSKLIRQCSMNILQAEIKCKKRELTTCFRHISRLNIELKNNVSHIVHTRLQSIINQIVLKSNNNVEKRHMKKLNRLRGDKIVNGNRTPKIDPVTDFSTRKLTTEERHVLSHGLHHVYPSDNFDHVQFVCNMEYFYARLLNVRTTHQHYEQKAPDLKVLHELTSIQLQVASEIRSIANTVRRKAPMELKQISGEHRRSFQVLQSLAKDRSIVITKPDKGRGVVVMNRCDYLQKMHTIVDDTSTFRRIDTDTTISNEDRLTNILRRLKKEGFITEGEYSLARPVGSMPARLYGLPKLHKTGIPMRPVMAATKTVGYGLGKVLTRRLDDLRKSPYVVKDSFEFVDKIRKSANAEKTMVSFDVKSLFTNVPLTYTIDLILDRMYPKCNTNCQGRSKARQCNDCRRREDFNILLRAATSEIQFIFDDKIYIQHNGVAMGAPLAPVIADIFMAHLENSLMDKLKQIGVQEWFRYVDDTFVLLNPNTSIDNVLNILNEFHPSIKFTHEPEENNSIPFLDVRVLRTEVKKVKEVEEDNEKEKEIITTYIFDTTIFRKETFTGLMTNWHSFVPFSYKKSSVVSMIKRALSICSTYSLLTEEFDKIRTICQKNDYPAWFIDIRIGIGLSKYLEKMKTNEPHLPVSGCPKRRMFIEIPYIGEQTDALKKKISRLTAESRPDLDIHYVAKPPRSVKTFFPTKDPVPKHLQSDIVYAAKCKDCGDTYVGKTERQCNRRLREHGAPKDTFDRNPGTDESENTLDIVSSTKNKTHHNRKSRKDKIEAKQLPTRRSSRIRNKKEAMVNNSSNQKIEQQITHATTERTKSDNPDVVLSSLAEHEKNTGHHIDWKNVRVLWRDNISYRLLIKESLVIRAHEPPLNRTTHSVPLLIFPEGLERNLVPDPNG